MWFQVGVQLDPNPAFLVQEKEQESHCICGNGRHTVSWAVTPKALGEEQSPRDNSLLKDCTYQQDPYI